MKFNFFMSGSQEDINSDLLAFLSSKWMVTIVNNDDYIIYIIIISIYWKNMYFLL